MKKTANRSSLFLLELMINLFLFVICAAVCVGLLLHARGMSLESKALTDAVYLAQSAAEEWRSLPINARPGPTDTVETESGTYVVTLTENRGAPGLRSCTISVSRGETVIYTLEEVCAPW